MEEIKENDFVRLDNGNIGQVIAIEKGSIMLDIVENRWIGICCIVKHSSNIKDLVQAGDIVIYTINCKMTDIEIVKEHTDARTLEKTLRVGLYSLEQVDIKSIVTKEQFANAEYRLEE